VVDNGTLNFFPKTLFFVALLVVISSTAYAESINTGSKTGSYHNDFGPRVESILGKQLFKHKRKTSQGSGENFDRVLASPTDVSLGQFDVIASAATEHPDAVTVIRDDVAMECVYAVTARDSWKTWGDVSALARRMRIALPAEKSGATSTFKFIQTFDKGLARARKISHYDSPLNAVLAVKQGMADIAFFVQFPNTDNKVFKNINDSGLYFVPVVSREMLRLKIDGRAVYRAQQVNVTPGGWLSSGKDVLTACTPVVLFTGNPGLFPADSNERLDQEDMIAALRKPDTKSFQPDKDWFQNVLANVKDVSGSTVEDMIAASEKAMEMAKDELE